MTNDSVLMMLEDRYLEPNDGNRKACLTCDICGEDIYEDDEYYAICGNNICESCMQDAHEIAEAM